MIFFAVFALLGLVCGFVGGLFGSGGGVILVFSLGFLLKRFCLNNEKKHGIFKKSESEGVNFDEKFIFCFTLCVTFASSAMSAILYFKSGEIEFGKALVFLICAPWGGLLGGILQKKLPLKALRWIFAIITIIAGGVLIIL